MSLVSPSTISKQNLDGASGPSSDLQRVLARIADAEKRSGRPSGSVTLIAVSKTKPAEAVLTAARKGLIHFGENYVQEASKKMERLQVLLPQSSLKWHLIGSLQTNKSKFVVGRFDTIQSVDRPELLKALNQRSAEAGVIQNILLQVKLGEEPTKAGVPAGELPQLVKEAVKHKNLNLKGLMSLPPLDVDVEASRKYFSQLRQLLEQTRSLLPDEKTDYKELSMGTTHDFEVAIEEGATMVRVGTAIFGGRESNIISL